LLEIDDFAAPGNLAPVEHIHANRPAHHAEQFFETIFGLTRDGLTDAAGVPHFLQIMAWARECEIYVPSPPLPLQRALSALLRPVAHLRGYKAWYPQYSPDAPTIR
jgi:hypothetical protein